PRRDRRDPRRHRGPRVSDPHEGRRRPPRPDDRVRRKPSAPSRWSRWRRRPSHIVARMWRRVLCIALVALGAVGSAIQPVHAAVPWAWPVAGPIIRGFEPPDGPYGAGHRGIDIAAELSTVIVAADAGVVTVAGRVGGRLFVSRADV